MRFPITAVLATFLSLGSCIAFADEPAETISAAAPEKKPVDAQTEESMRAFASIVCDAAVDKRSPAHIRALRIVESRKLRDPRFAEFVRDTAATKPTSESDAVGQVRVLAALMPVSDISPAECVTILLDRFNGWQHQIWPTDRVAVDATDLLRPELFTKSVIETAAILKNYQRELLVELAKRLDTDDPAVVDILAVRLLRINASSLLPLLVRAARSDNESVRFAAIDVIDRMEPLWAVKQLTESELPLGVVKGAKGLMNRLDKDKNGTLDKEERAADPAYSTDSDQNGDGEIDLIELANALMKARQR